MATKLTKETIMMIGACIMIGSLIIGVGAYDLKHKRRDTKVASLLTDGEPMRAPVLMRRYGCTGCHTVPGLPGAQGKVGGSLAGLRERVYIAGVLNNTSDNLVAWMMSPQTFSSKTAMPATGINRAEAQDVAAYLYAQ